MTECTRFISDQNTPKCGVARIEAGGQSGENGEPVYYIRDNSVGFDMRYADFYFTLAGPA